MTRETVNTLAQYEMPNSLPPLLDLSLLLVVAIREN
jgi:hypothetical protein